MTPSPSFRIVERMKLPVLQTYDSQEVYTVRHAATVKIPLDFRFPFFLSSYNYHSFHEHQFKPQIRIKIRCHESLPSLRFSSYISSCINQSYRFPSWWRRAFSWSDTTSSTRSTPIPVRFASSALVFPKLTIRNSAPLPQSADGVLQDLSIINYTPNNPSNRQHSCWTYPRSGPDPKTPYAKGVCSVCVARRDRTDGGADYQVWARDDKNNAMGNMPVTSVWRLDDMGLDQTTAEDTPAVLMGGSQLQLWAMSAENPSYSVVYLRWATPPYTISLPMNDTAIPQVMFDLSPNINAGDNCVSAGDATNGAVVYFICFFPC